jgi:hypothetical protein
MTMGESTGGERKNDVMITGFEKIVEERIKKAQRDGEFENLPGRGHPLDLAQDHYIPEDMRLAYKMLKNADCLPPEIEMRKEVARTEELLANMPDTAERHRIMKKLNYMIMKVNASRGGNCHFDIPQHYLGVAVEKLSPPENKSSGT